MSLAGEYEPSSQGWVREQVEQYEGSGGTSGTTLRELQDGPQKWTMRAREVTGSERAEWWDRAVAAYPPYAGYQQKTDRTIPVFVLERAGSQ